MRTDTVDASVAAELASAQALSAISRCLVTSARAACKAAVVCRSSSSLSEEISALTRCKMAASAALSSARARDASDLSLSSSESALRCVSASMAWREAVAAACC